jgi:hypothetical protein
MKKLETFPTLPATAMRPEEREASATERENE